MLLLFAVATLAKYEWYVCTYDLKFTARPLDTCLNDRNKHSEKFIIEDDGIFQYQYSDLDCKTFQARIAMSESCCRPHETLPEYAAYEIQCAQSDCSDSPDIDVTNQFYNSKCTDNGSQGSFRFELNDEETAFSLKTYPQLGCQGTATVIQTQRCGSCVSTNSGNYMKFRCDQLPENMLPADQRQPSTNSDSKSSESKSSETKSSESSSVQTPQSSNALSVLSLMALVFVLLF